MPLSSELTLAATCSGSQRDWAQYTAKSVVPAMTALLSSGMRAFSCSTGSPGYCTVRSHVAAMSLSSRRAGSDSSVSFEPT